MADEALRELLEWLRNDGLERSGKQWVRLRHTMQGYTDALESALSELARLRALRDHGKYLADAAEIYLNVMSDDDPEPDLSADSYGALRSCVYEFRKRFAQTSPVQSHEEKRG